VKALAYAEDLPAHWRAVEVRFDDRPPTSPTAS
jgi:hypothetical protein